MKSVISCLNSETFTRVRVGIGKPDHEGDRINYVTNRLPNEEKNILQKGVDSAANAVIEIIQNGIDIAMNKFN